MHIVVGSMNQAKIKAVKHVFKANSVTALKAPSNVSKQPFSDLETRSGAIHRAKFAKESVKDESNVFGIGLEGGVMKLNNQYYLCNWGALALPDGKIIDASGVRILLPQSIIKQLQLKRELGEVMAQLTNDKEVRQKAGAIGVLTNNALTRQDIYVHIAKLLKGQYEFYQQKTAEK